MGRLIEESRVVEILQQTWLSGTIAHRFIDDIKRRIRIEVPTVEAIPKADYEKRLKADMVAMLEEIQLEIDEKEYLDGEEPIIITQDYIDEVKSWEYGKKNCYDIIQQKINSLKESKNV